MSHFTVLVITDTPEQVDEVMAPYDENIQVDRYETQIAEKPTDFWATDLLVAEGLVPLNPTAEQVVEAYHKKYDVQPDEQMFVRNGVMYEWSTYNPKSQWDWYQMGGRWRGFFQLKPLASVGDPQSLAAQAEARLGEPGTFEHLDMQEGKGPHANYQGKADQARKREVDFDAMRDLAGHEAEVTFDKFSDVIKDLPLPKSWPTVLSETLTAAGLPTEWDEFYEQNKPKPNPLTVPRDLSEEELLNPELFSEVNRSAPLDDDKQDTWRKPWDAALSDARRIYHEQPMITALAEADFHFWFDSPEERFFLGDPDARQKFIDRARSQAFSTYAVVKDGEWYQKGKMGWWGMSRDEMDESEWLAKIDALLDDLPDDAVLTILDCHI